LLARAAFNASLDYIERPAPQPRAPHADVRARHESCV